MCYNIDCDKTNGFFCRTSLFSYQKQDAHDGSRSLIWCNITCYFQNLLTRRFLKRSLYIHTRQSSPTPWQPCFSTDQNNLNNFDRGSPKEHLCHIIFFKSVQDLWTRTFLKYSLYTNKKENKLWPLVANDFYHLHK